MHGTTYCYHAGPVNSQLASHYFVTVCNNFDSIQGDGVKFYLEDDGSNKQKIAIFTYLSEEPINPSSNKYYLQLRKEDHSIVAITESKVESSQRFLFQFR